MRAEVWRQILGMSLYNFIILSCVLFFGPLMMEELTLYSMKDRANGGMGVKEEVFKKFDKTDA